MIIETFFLHDSLDFYFSGCTAIYGSTRGGADGAFRL
jgi:hypothetical protein